MFLSVDNIQYEVDEEGFLIHFTDWKESISEEMARIDGIILAEGHWEVIKFLRSYYAEFEIAPPIRMLTKAMKRRLGVEKGNSRYLYHLFPDGPAKQACRYAGLPKPTGCI